MNCCGGIVMSKALFVKGGERSKHSGLTNPVYSISMSLFIEDNNVKFNSKTGIQGKIVKH